jgi:hypothetical protein
VQGVREAARDKQDRHSDDEHRLIAEHPAEVAGGVPVGLVSHVVLFPCEAEIAEPRDTAGLLSGIQRQGTTRSGANPGGEQ